MMANEQERRIYDRCLTRVGELEAENAQLRELIHDMWTVMWYCPTESCATCAFNEDDVCIFEIRMLKLGIELIEV